MSLIHAILGFLNRQPMTGYELKTKCFDVSVSYFWPADQAQIYRTLEKMEFDGLLESEIYVQNERPNRKQYRITAVGQTELIRWLQESLPLPVQRVPFLVQLFFSENVSNPSIIHQLELQKELHEKQLRLFQSIESQINAVSTPEHEPAKIDVLGYATLRRGILTEEAYIRWIEETIEMVNQFPDALKRTDQF